MKHLAIIILLLLACGDKKNKSNAIITNKTNATISFSGEYKICDTCQMIILVHHEECTTCGEITIDSGTVYLTNELLKNIQKLVVNSDTLELTGLSPNYVSIHELYFADKNYFRQLWTDTIGFTDLDKTFRLRGKVVEIKRRILENGVVEIYPSLFLKVDEAVEVGKRK